MSTEGTKKHGKVFLFFSHGGTEARRVLFFLTLCDYVTVTRVILLNNEIEIFANIPVGLE